ncbi:High choriolytic enzyme 1 [Orchesella cincta]|uniref:Metalloendopeptidase n=1 Tax=Orchesella cincta TaxID=48709 RepID=A0A1D2M8M9_ORCCI|nr:High choriolytic enzyme 1 [Orchesella cincta]
MKNPMLGEYFEGDMRFAKGYDIKSGIIGSRYRWPNNTVPYIISSSFSTDEEEIVLGALAEISEKTCIRFVQRFSQRDYVSIVRGKPNSGCWSYIGKIGGGQLLNLQAGPRPHCIYHGTVVHEMTHALGFHHEQSRTDRDDYVNILWNNIIPKFKHNFNKYSSSQVDSQEMPYDYSSIMHYDAYAFALNTSKPTIVPKSDVQIGQKKGLSALDTEKLKTMYRCKTPKFPYTN